MRTGNSSQITCFGGEKKAKTKQYGGHTDFCLKGEHGGTHLSTSTQILRRRGREDEPGTILSYCGSGREQEDQVQRKCTRPYAKLAAHYRLPSQASRLAFLLLLINCSKALIRHRHSQPRILLLHTFRIPIS